LKTPTVDRVCGASAEIVAGQPILKASIFSKTVDVKGVSRVGYWLSLGFHLVISGPLRSSENRPLNLFWLLMHLYSLKTPQPRCKEWLGGCIAIDQDRIIADCAGQDMGNRTEDGESVFAEQEDSPVNTN
jgi:hypothetical protein